MGKMPNKSMVNINDYHYAAGHFHEALLRKIVDQQGILLEGTLLECKGYSMTAGSAEVPSRPHTLEQIRSSGGFL